MSLSKVYSFATGEKLSEALSEYVAHLSQEAIARNGRFTVAFSGGSLPSTVCRFLKDNKEVDFSKWYVFWADERCVTLDNDESNFKLLRKELLDHLVQTDRGIPPEQVMQINEDLVGDRNAAAEDYQEKLESVFAGTTKTKFPDFDCILLGIGPDGHTCSLFPNHPLLEEKSKWVASLDDSPKEPPCRITLTYPVLNHASNVVFVANGAGKRKTLKKILDEKDTNLPASHVAPIKGTLSWFLDDAAAKDLSDTNVSSFKL
ncbi:suppressor of los1-1 [Coemansia guatemalensis]|uniref:6-phosphogluconolactonase n=1 Tax=Coemansia guatemalensis TaxID=2761395 RepID=A0A9W8LWT9_9FUNG|nr:suppressor of los1-1 [Coemansia guatemalensis]